MTELRTTPQPIQLVNVVQQQQVEPNAPVPVYPQVPVAVQSGHAVTSVQESEYDF